MSTMKPGVSGPGTVVAMDARMSAMDLVAV